VLGLLYLYRKNGGATGKQFLQRYFPLSITVGWKFATANFVIFQLISIVLEGESKEVLGWSSSVSLAIMNVLMFWRIGVHLKSLSNEASA
jgi:hypothetical protein